MEIPDDPGGSGLQVSHNVTISNVCEESSMDTDGSVNGPNPNLLRKRINATKVCKHCNKKRKRQRNSSTAKKPKESDCQCILESDVEKIPNSLLEANTNDSTKNQGTTDDLQSHVSNSSDINIDKNKDNPLNTPPPSVARGSYTHTDVAPYLVHIQKHESSPDDDTTLHPITFGRFLKKNFFKNIINGSLKRIGRNRLSLSFSTFSDANSFIANDNLAAHKFKAYIPSFNTTRMGLVRGVPSDWSPEEVMENINVPIGCGKILKVRRLKKKAMVNGEKTFIDTESIVVTFDGQVLPKRVFMCYNSLPVDLYIYPTIQCYHCCRYGHVKAQCRSKPTCYKCGQGHTGDNCKVDDDFLSCCWCDGQHFATSRKCPEYERQVRIKETMAKSCISYPEANKLHPRVHKSYADVVASVPPPTNSYKKDIILRDKVDSNQPQKTSYRKTVFLKPRSPQQPFKGYDQMAHKNLIKDYDMPSSTNGSALNQGDNNPIANMSVTDLIIALINTLKQSNLTSPSNVASDLDTFSQIINHNNGQQSQSSPVELPQYN